MKDHNVDTFSDGMKKVRSGWVLLFIKHVKFISLDVIYKTLKTTFDHISNTDKRDENANGSGDSISDELQGVWKCSQTRSIVHCLDHVFP